ncbi:helix-turn-helix transcriptional regulator [Novosphingobium sp.]|uniref:helix-turn-helix domain-containing protein n=1 Tax=Novosphingobium sp. TaxID=1874826 RepID=UPI0025CE587C|nr:helix-turn-helix transcriptional regulator [Novosphingobium sp.]
MAIAAHMDEAPSPATTSAGQARDPRRVLHLDAEGALPSGARTNVRVHNVSTSGLLLETAIRLTVGERIEIDLPHATATWARVIWTSDDLSGCQFEQPISEAALSAAQLRATPGQPLELAERSPETAPGESFGTRLQRLRKDRGFTLAQVAAQLGVSKPTVWAWEQGKAKPVESRIEALAAVYGVHPSDLVQSRISPALFELIARSKEQIAEAVGTTTDKIRIMIDL